MGPVSRLNLAGERQQRTKGPSYPPDPMSRSVYLEGGGNPGTVGDGVNKRGVMRLQGRSPDHPSSTLLP